MNELTLFVLSVMVYMVGVLWGHFVDKPDAPRVGQIIMLVGAVLTVIIGFITLW